MEKAIYFDMDGTLAGLFYVKGFRAMLDKNDVTPFKIAPALFEKESMEREISRLKGLGYTIGIISYCCATGEHAKEVRKAKKEWLNVNFPYATEVHIVQKQKTKYAVAKIKNAILVDDAKKNRAEWHGKTINAYRANLVEELSKITE